MSVHIMGQVWDSDLERDEKYVLLAYADHADHTGRNIYPSDELVAWKTGYSERQVIRIRLKLIGQKILLRDGSSPFGTQMYQIDVDALPRRTQYKNQRRGRPSSSPESHQNGSEIGDTMSPDSPKTGDTLSPNSEKQVTPCHSEGDISEKQVTSATKIGDIAMSLNPSLTVNLKPSDSTEEALQEKIEKCNYSPVEAWNSARSQLQAEMPKAAFENWVRDTQVLDYQPGKFYVLCGNGYARDWLQSRIKSTVTRLLTGICNRTIEVLFIAHEDLAESIPKAL